MRLICPAGWLVLQPAFGAEAGAAVAFVAAPVAASAAAFWLVPGLASGRAARARDGCGRGQKAP